MRTMPRRPRFYLGVLAGGFLAGGFLNALLVRFLPDSAAKGVFTYSLAGSIGPVSLDLLVVSFTLGPVGINVSLLSLVGVVLAYLIARSLF